MIQIQDLNFRYGKKNVFTGLSLKLQAGHVYGLLGKNGTGKSTLLKTIAGSLFPVKGKVEVMGFQPGKRQAAFLRQVFLVPEEIYLPNLSITSFVKSNAGFYPNFSQSAFDFYLSAFTIPAAQSLQEMSYGQKKKVLISFALACNTLVLLMDEPTNGLDIVSKSQFKKVLSGAIDEKKCIVISTHQVKDLENLIDRITIIDEGNILFDQTVENINNKLQFFTSYDNYAIQDALYYESSLAGNAIITANQGGKEGKPDLEMLYKAIVTNRDAIQSAFK